jgi:hypothetical protein
MGGCVEHISTDGPRNCRSLHFATPDFLLDLVALLQFMRPSLRKGAYAALSSAAWQEIRVRFGRDDTFALLGTREGTAGTRLMGELL